MMALGQAEGPDKQGCSDPKVLSRMPGCRLRACRTMEHDAVRMYVEEKAPLVEKTGAVEEVSYSCPATVSALQIAQNVENALGAAGFRIVFRRAATANVRYVTANRGGEWVAVKAVGSHYTVNHVTEAALKQEMTASADGWAAEINQTGRVSVYGINFDTARATIRPESEKVLAELATLLGKNPEWYLLVAGHTDNTGSDQVNVPLSAQRAEAVIAWLAGHGVERGRLSAAGFGSRKPLADNGTEEGRAKNRRVDLIKLY
jgi:outer membrane protein OmpA-like peptidoglycan-associated protein